jgi:hypothetical protein
VQGKSKSASLFNPASIGLHRNSTALRAVVTAAESKWLGLNVAPFASDGGKQHREQSQCVDKMNRVIERTMTGASRKPVCAALGVLPKQPDEIANAPG